MPEEVTLRPIDENNFLDAFRLELAPGQEKYVSGPIRSLAQAYVYREQCQPFGIYAGERMVGYVMVIYDYDIPEYDIWHMMVDRAHQGRGYGKKALEKCLEYIRTKPFGGSNRVALTCHEENPAALRLYRSLGFEPTGQRDEEEIELALELKN
ncbi:MAG: GNAT family N-acetyltransferase [Faecousia sp.]